MRGRPVADPLAGLTEVRDPYLAMSEALAKRAAIDAEIDRLIASRSDVEMSVKGLASALLNGSNGRHGLHEAESPMAPIEPIQAAESGEARAPIDVGHLPPRMIEQLRLLRDNPDQDYGFFAVRMYGQDSRKSRLNVSAYFSMLKTRGYVKSIGVAMFELTAKGAEIAKN